jgi:signal transduction histidine kinase
MRDLSFARADEPLNLSPASHQVLLNQLRHKQFELERQKAEVQRTELALENSNARFIALLEYTSALYNLAPVGYLTLTDEGTVLEANLTAVTLLASPRGSLLKQAITNFIVEADHDTFYTLHRQLLATGRSSRCELRMMRADGSSFFGQIDAVVTKSLLGEDSFEESSQGNSYIRFTLSDISAHKQHEEDERKIRAELEAALLDLRQTQEQVIRQERLAVVGQMAAGIAHDFNNIMASITLYAQLVLRATELAPTLHKRIEAIITQSERAATLVQQILDFGRRTVMARQATAISNVLEQAVDILQRTLPDTIQVTFDNAVGQTGVDDIADIDPGRVEQMLLNLGLNSRDAMPNGGRLHIALARVRVDTELSGLASGTLAPGLWLRIDVKDSGTGIKSEDMPRLFEPFFTTKGIGHGSGLGLSQVWGLVKQHDGEIDVRSEVGNGTTFTIYLPASSQTPVAPPPEEPTEVPRGQGELVLVAEDSDFLRAAIISVLKQLGYQTVATSHGQEALDYISKDGANIELILTDLSMPVMGGQELIRSLRAQGWKQPVIVLSGQPLSASEIEELDGYGQVTRLQKPAAMMRLALALYKSLKSSAS